MSVPKHVLKYGLVDFTELGLGSAESCLKMHKALAESG